VRALSALRQLLQIAWSEDPKRLGLSGALMLLQSAALPLAASAMQHLTDLAVQGDVRGASTMAALAAAFLIASLTAGHFAHIFYFELGDLMMLRLQAALISLSNGTPGLQHHENKEYTDRLHVLRQELTRAGSSSLGAALGSVGMALAILTTAALLGSRQPWLLLLPVAAVPPLLLGRRAESVSSRARVAASPSLRRARHLFLLATDSGSGKELRVGGLGNEIRSRQSAAWAEAGDILWRAEVRAAASRIAGQLVFTLAYVVGTLLVVRGAIAGKQTVGDVFLALTLAAQVNHQLTSAVSSYQELERVATALAELGWMRRTTAAPLRLAASDVPPPPVLTTGIKLDAVTFRYPGTQTPAVERLSLDLPAGSTIALVGENGAGKSTLIKLLCGFYEPDDGRIEVDGFDLRQFPIGAWRERIAAGFQDFVKFEFLARETVGLGDLPNIDSPSAVRAALTRARAGDLLDQLEHGWATKLGSSNPDGIDLSHGQWQKLALSRAMMRERPLLLVLDEPTSALDAQAEHALFQQYAENARRLGDRTGAITLLVSHRFSTVRMADKIIVISGKTVSEVGAHDELMRRGGLYAELYGLQARVFQ
jgi:ATP-binding cassette subfamily B protein